MSLATSSTSFATLVSIPNSCRSAVKSGCSRFADFDSSSRSRTLFDPSRTVKDHQYYDDLLGKRLERRDKLQHLSKFGFTSESAFPDIEIRRRTDQATDNVASNSESFTSNASALPAVEIAASRLPILNSNVALPSSAFPNHVNNDRRIMRSVAVDHLIVNRTCFLQLAQFGQRRAFAEKHVRPLLGSRR